MGLETKQNEKTRSSPQISGVMVSHNNTLSPQNGVIGANRYRLPNPEAEGSLRMVVSGAGFRGGTLYRPKYR